MAAFCGFPPAGTRPQGTRWHLFHTTGLLRLTRPLSAARTHRLSAILPGLPAPSLHPAVLLLLLAQPHCAGRFLPPVPAGSALGIAARARAQPGGGSSCSASPVSPEQGREGAPAPPAAGPGVRFLLKKRKNEKNKKAKLASQGYRRWAPNERWEHQAGTPARSSPQCLLTPCQLKKTPKTHPQTTHRRSSH